MIGKMFSVLSQQNIMLDSDCLFTVEEVATTCYLPVLWATHLCWEDVFLCARMDMDSSTAFRTNSQYNLGTFVYLLECDVYHCA